MLNQLPINEPEQYRVDSKISTIQSAREGLTQIQSEETQISADGSQLTTQTNTTSLEIDGEIIHDILRQIIGKCQESDCGQYVTRRTFRSCGNPDCNKILCHHHARYHSKERAFFCQDCYKWIRIKRFFLVLFRIILFPFIRRGRRIR